MQVRCIDDIGCLHITGGKVYKVIKKLNSIGEFLIIDDRKEEHCYQQQRFEEVKEMEIENVLELEYQEVFGDKVAIRVSYQNDKVLKRGNFVDYEIGVASFLWPDFNMLSLYIRGSNTSMDNHYDLVSKEKAEEIKEKVRRINEKYGIRKRWRAKDGCIYYYVDSSGKVSKCKDLYISVDDARYELGNYFRTKTGAKKALEKIKQALNELK